MSYSTQGQLTTSPATVVSLPGQVATIVKVVFCNESGSPVTISYGVTIKASGLAAGAAGTAVGRTWTLGAAGSTTHTLEATELVGFTLGVADAVWAVASTGAAVSWLASVGQP